MSLRIDFHENFSVEIIERPLKSIAVPCQSTEKAETKGGGYSGAGQRALCPFHGASSRLGIAILQRSFKRCANGSTLRRTKQLLRVWCRFSDVAHPNWPVRAGSPQMRSYA